MLPDYAPFPTRFVIFSAYRAKKSSLPGGKSTFRAQKPILPREKSRYTAPQ
jgi:hypothetical protein